MGLSAAPAAYVLTGFFCVSGLAGFSDPAANLSMAESAGPSLLASLLAASSHDELQTTKHIADLTGKVCRSALVILWQAMSIATNVYCVMSIPQQEKRHCYQSCSSVALHTMHITCRSLSRFVAGVGVCRLHAASHSGMQHGHTCLQGASPPPPAQTSLSMIPKQTRYRMA